MPKLSGQFEEIHKRNNLHKELVYGKVIDILFLCTKITLVNKIIKFQKHPINIFVVAWKIDLNYKL